MQAALAAAARAALLPPLPVPVPLLRAAAAAALRQLRASSSSSSAAARPRQAVPLTYPAVCVWGANTGVGKTLVSAGLVAAAVRQQVHVQYIKPVQTGHPADWDARLVAAAAAAATSREAAAAFLADSATLFGFKDPVSPHLAAAAEQRSVADAEVVAGVAHQLRAFTQTLLRAQRGPQPVQGLSVVETAGGVTSPGPSGTLQGDLLRPLALPALLVGDAALGGISTTLSAYESLLLRGAAVGCVVMMAERRYNNAAAVAQQLANAATHRLGQELPVLALPMCQPPPAGASTSGSSDSGGGIDAQLAAWLAASVPQFDELLLLLQRSHEQRLAWLQQAPAEASSSVWWPFTQHAQLPSGDVTVVDARAGEDWLVYQQPPAAAPANDSSSSSEPDSGQVAGDRGVLTPLHDAASSWWTQTAASPQQQLEVTRAVASAAGRYSHVMWPQVAHAPGLALTQTLLRGPLGAGWASRAFFSDNGSTAVEVALKMGLRKYAADHGLDDGLERGERGAAPVLDVVALENAYHGDTLGAMDCASPSPFNGPRQTPWYSGRGCFLAPPYLALQRGRWALRPPAWLCGSEQPPGDGGWSWGSQDEAFDVAGRSSSQLAWAYAAHIAAAIDQHEAAPAPDGRPRRVAALLFEPLLQGAGGMLLVDPLFQAQLVQACRARRIPVIYDEVFSGCWRTGTPTAGAVLGVHPDIACYAKLLTGGAAPLAVTLTSEAVFDAFSGPSKMEALLHGHSYTAYPLGCAAAVASLGIITSAALNPNLCTPAAPGRCDAEAIGGPRCAQPCGRLRSQWDAAAVAALSGHPRVAGVVALGSVLAVELAAAAGAPGGYASSAAAGVVACLRRRGIAARPLGPVVYVMATPTSTRATCAWLAGELAHVLAAEQGDWADGGAAPVLI